MDTLLLALRVVLSLGAVVAVLWLVQRRVTRNTRGRGTADPVKVVARRGLGQKASVVVVDTGGQRFVLGVTEHSVNVLHSADAPDDGVLPQASREVARLRLVGETAQPESAQPGYAQPDYSQQDYAQPEYAQQEAAGGTAAQAFAQLLAEARGNPDAMRRALLGGVPDSGMDSPGTATSVPATRRSAHAPAGAPQRFRERHRSSSALDGSILAPSTWKQAAAVIRKGIIG